MALLTITLQDMSDGSVDIGVNVEPIVPEDAPPESLTEAQQLGFVALAAVLEHTTDEPPEPEPEDTGLSTEHPHGEPS